jgi:hypothetical protein
MHDALAFLRALADAESRANPGAPGRSPSREAANDNTACATDRGRSPTWNRGDCLWPHHGDDRIFVMTRPRGRSIFAIARYVHDGIEVFRAWMGSTGTTPLGDGIRESLYVCRENGRLTVVSRYEVCSNCLGAATERTGQICEACGGDGWFHRGGQRWLGRGRMVELRKLGPPSDPRYRRAYDAIG